MNRNQPPHEVTRTARLMTCTDCGQVVIREGEDGPLVHDLNTRILRCWCSVPGVYCTVHDRNGTPPAGPVLRGEDR